MIRRAAIVPVATLVLAGCGGSDKPTVILDTERVERAIEQSVLQKRGLEARVSCPSGVHQGKGLTFECTATLKNGAVTRFEVRQTDDLGHVTYVGLG